MGAEDDIKGILGVASQICFIGTVVATAREAYGHWMRQNCARCGGASRLTCEHCRGRGKLEKPTQRGDFSDIGSGQEETFPCMFCQSKGSVLCRVCNGAGSEISDRFNWSRMVRPNAPFRELLRNRNFGLIPNPIEQQIAKTAKEETLEEFIHNDMEDLEALTKKIKRRRVKRAAKRAARAARAQARKTPPRESGSNGGVSEV